MGVTILDRTASSAVVWLVLHEIASGLSLSARSAFPWGAELASGQIDTARWAPLREALLGLEPRHRWRQAQTTAGEAFDAFADAIPLDHSQRFTGVVRGPSLLALPLGYLWGLCPARWPMAEPPMDIHPTCGLTALRAFVRHDHYWPAWRPEQAVLLVSAELGETEAVLGRVATELDYDGDEAREVAVSVPRRALAAASVRQQGLAQAIAAAQRLETTVVPEATSKDLLDAMEGRHGRFVQVLAHQHRQKLRMSDADVDLRELLRGFERSRCMGWTSPVASVSLVVCHSTSDVAPAFFAAGVPDVSSIVGFVGLEQAVRRLAEIYTHGLLDGARSMSTALVMAQSRLFQRSLQQTSV